MNATEYFRCRRAGVRTAWHRLPVCIAGLWVLAALVMPVANAATAGARAAGLAPNLLPNASFECGRDGWVGEGRPMPEIGLDPQGAHSGVQDACLPNGSWLSSSWLALAPSTAYTFQVFARGTGTLLLQFKDGNVTFTGGPFQQQSVTLSDPLHFHPYSLVFHAGAKPDNGIVYMGSYGSGIAVDDISVVASSAAPVPFQPMADTELGIADAAPYGVITGGPGSGAALTVTSSNPRLRGTYLCRVDESGHQWSAAWITFSRRANGLWQAYSTARDLPPGYWHLVTSATPQARPSPDRVEGETFVSVVPPMPAAPLRDWFYGSHIPAGDTAMQEAVWRMGIRWDRLHDTDTSLDWASYEPQKGQWNENKAGVSWHKGTPAHPLALLGDIDKDWLPGWVPQASPKFAHSLNNLDPSELQDGSDWYALCAHMAAADADALATTYGGGAPAYLEISNEPDNPYVASWDPPLSPAAYVQELKVAYDAVKSANPHVQVVAQASFAYPDGGTIRDEIQAGMLRCCDVVTYHGYGFDIDGNPQGSDQSGGKSPRYGGDYQRAAVQTLKDEMRADPKPIWAGEAGMYGMASCFEKFAHPYLWSQTRTLPGSFHAFPDRPYNSAAYDEARAYAESACVTKSSGIQRMLYYESNSVHDQADEMHTNTIRWGDINDIMKEPMQALAVAVSLLQNTAFFAGRHDPATGLVHLTFTQPLAGRRTRQVDVYWLDPSHMAPVRVPLAEHAPRALARISMWGRPLPAAGTLSIDQDPIYVVSVLPNP